MADNRKTDDGTADHGTAEQRTAAVPSESDDLRRQVQDYYRRAAVSGASACGVTGDGRWGADRYEGAALAGAPTAATALSMGCGNPHALIDLQPGEVVLDLGSGGGLDVILSARRVGPSGKAYGIDFLEEMVEQATVAAEVAGVSNVEILHGEIEAIPLPDASVDVVISNCVINLAPDKAPVFAEIARVLRPGGRMAVADVVGEPGRSPGSSDGWADCGAGALPLDQYQLMLAAAGLEDVQIELTHETGPGLHGAAIRATRP